MKQTRRPTIAPSLLGALLLASLAFFSAPVLGQPTGGVEVSFTTRDMSGNPLALRGHLWTPAGEAKGAVVLVHGSGGWSDHREGHYGRALSAAGYAALAIDAFGPRGIRETTEDQSQITTVQMTRDAFAARRLLLERGIKADRTAIMGFSKGGTATLNAADRNFLPEETDRFAVVIPFYPGCVVRTRVPRPSGAVFMALGDKDDYTGVEPCQEVAAALRNAGGKVSVKIYPGAAHGFDGHPARTGMIDLPTVENFMNCVLHLEEDGQYSYQGKRYAENDPELTKEMRRTCVRKGASVWTNLRQKEAATRDVIHFLDNSFGK